VSAHAFYLPALGSGPTPPPGRHWPLASREPLPPKPPARNEQPPDPESQCWRKEEIDSALPPVPDHPDRFFCRGNFCLIVPGFTGGYNDKDRRVVMTWDVPTMPEADEDYVLDYYATVFTHVLLSIPHGKNNGMTLEQLTTAALKAKARGLFVMMNAVSDGDSFDVAVPWLDHLLAKGALVPGEDSVCFCWQVDRYYDPPRLCDELILQSAYCVPHQLGRWVHWLNGACAWWTPEDEHDPNGSCMRFGVCDRFSFQTFAVNYLDGHLGQLDHNTQLDELQSNDAKVLQSLPPPLRLCCAEQSAQGLYDQPSDAMALYGRQKGRYVMASHYHDQTMQGAYFNDASRDDGSPL
jgi:hypothetical protein